MIRFVLASVAAMFVCMLLVGCGNDTPPATTEAPDAPQEESPMGPGVPSPGGPN